MLPRPLLGVLLIGATLSCNACAQTKPGAAPAAAAIPGPDTDVSSQLSWPRIIKDGGETITVYQPQVDSWTDDQLQARAALSVAVPGKKEPSYGVIWITARTEVDKSNRLVTLEDIQFPKVLFPQDKAGEAQYLASIRAHVGDATRVVALDHLEADLSITQEKKAAAVEVKNDPPKIIFTKTPTLLILIDGAPALRQVAGVKLMRVVNTRALILLDQVTNRYFLQAVDCWFESAQPLGPWQLTTQPPPGAEDLKASLAKSNTVDLLAPSDPGSAPPVVPQILVSSTPAELLQTSGDPKFTPIAATNLLYATNTDSALFMLVTTQEYFVLVSGRWFVARSLEGPWAFVPGKDLPGDFAKIPADSPRANVRLSVPGTPEASQAVIANSIPQTAAVTIADAHLTVAYDGEPKFVKVAGAENLSYAVNTASPVIRIDDAKTFWCVNSGVWFSAAEATGPWVVATAVPGVIYTMPVSCPIHYVTYVRIYSHTPTVVYVGYTPGYMGTCVTSDGVVVYGTGYYYPAYVGTEWVGYPPTYGYGAGFACGTATGFAFGFAAGAIIGNCWAQPYWGPCWGYGHVDINTSSVYHNWHGGVTYANSHYEYDASSGKSIASRGGTTFNPYTGRTSAGGYKNYVDRDSGDFSSKRGAATYDPKTGVISAGGSHISGNAYDGDVNVDRAGGHYNTRTGNGIGHENGDVYASHDGNVYRHTDDGWQQHTDNGWQDAPKSDRSFSQQRQNLDAQRSSRDLGQQRFQGLQQSGSFRSRGGGGFRRR